MSQRTRTGFASQARTDSLLWSSEKLQILAVRWGICLIQGVRYMDFMSFRTVSLIFFIGNYSEAITRTCPVMQRYPVFPYKIFNPYPSFKGNYRREVTGIHGVPGTLWNGWSKGGYPCAWVYGTFTSRDCVGVVSTSFRPMSNHL